MPDISEDGKINTGNIFPYSEVKKGFTCFREGDVLFAKITPCMENGKGALAVGLRNGIGCGSTEFHVLRPNTEIIQGKWLYYLTVWTAFRKDAERHMSGSAGQKRVPKAFLEKFELQLPSLCEQSFQVETLDRVKAVIELRKQELQCLDTLIKARFVEMFGEIKEYCDVGYYIKSLVAGKSLVGEEECENKVLKTGAASFDFFDATQVKNLPIDYVPQHEHLVNVGDIIISRMNTADLTGAAAYVWNVPEKVYLPDRLWKAVLQEKCNPIFVWQMLIQPTTKEQIRRECSGTSGSMKNISKPGMLAIKVKKVPIVMQNQFADFVKQVNKSKFALHYAIN